jgi:hypothetical protein
MYLALHNILNDFEPLFSRKGAHCCFVIVILGFLLRFDFYGVSSTVRWLGLSPLAYDSLIHFFHASSWTLDSLMAHWLNWCVSHFELLKINERLVCLGDGIKIPKEARRQPGVVPMRSPSNNSGKAEKFAGHHIGAVALVTGKDSKIFAVPSLLEIHEGVTQLRLLQEGQNAVEEKPTVITRMITLSQMAAMKINEPIYTVLDGLYSTGQAFILARSRQMKPGVPWVHLIVKGKKNYTAYKDESLKKEAKIKVWKLFEKKEAFTSTLHPTTSKPISYLAINLWWPPAAGFLRFVLVQQGKRRFVLMSTDLELDPLTLIQIYSLRGKLEVTFGVLKNIIGGFCYRFWSASSPKLEKKKIKKKDQSKEVSPLALEQKRLEKQLSKLEAIERFINLAAIVVGILQYLAIRFTSQIWKAHLQSSWLRTYSSEIPSEEVVKRVIQAQWFLPCKNRQLAWITKFIDSFNSDPSPSKIRHHHTLGTPMTPG